MPSVRKIQIIDSSCVFQDDYDDTKKMYLELSSITPGTQRTITIPDADTILVGIDIQQVLNNKTLVDTTTFLANNSDMTKKIKFNLANISTGTIRTFTVPDSTTSLVGTDVSQTLTNKSLVDTTTYFQSNSDSTKKIQFSLTGVTTGITRVLTVPDTDITIVGISATQTITNKTINADNNTLTNIADGSIKTAAGINASKIADGSVTNTQYQYLGSLTSGIVSVDGTQTLNNKTFTDASTYIVDDQDNTKKIQFDVSGISTSTTRTLTFPDINTTIVGSNATQTLTNKTIDAANNTLTNIDDSGIKSGAAINAAKIANGTVGNTQYQYLSGTTSNIQGQINSHTGNSSNPHSVTKTQVGLSNVENLKVNLIATTNPSTTNDSNSGYSVGSRWINTTSDKEYVCTDSTVSSAVWKMTVADGVGQPVISYNESSSTSSTTGTSYVQKVRLTFTSSAADYLVQWYAEAKSSDATTRVKIRTQIDGATTIGDVDWIPDTSGSVGYGPVSGFIKVTLTAASHNFDILYAAASSGKSVSIRNARICATKLS